MRTITIALAVVIGLGLFANAAQAGDWSLEEFVKSKKAGEWEGYGVGTMIHKKMVQEMSMPQMPTPQKQETEEKRTLVEITDTEYVIKVESNNGGQWITSEERIKKDDGLKAVVVDEGEGTLSVAGTDYACAKKRVKWMKGEELDEQVILWVHDGKGILKMEFIDEGAVRGSATVTALDVSLTIGGTTVSGRDMDMEINAPGMGMLKGKAQISMEVPEHQVTIEFAGGQGPMKFKRSEKLVAFVKK